ATGIRSLDQSVSAPAEFPISPSWLQYAQEIKRRQKLPTAVIIYIYLYKAVGERRRIKGLPGIEEKKSRIEAALG
ncbi:Hypothetical predicted protein, partial [Olea europaea subsp. europaea]